MASVRGLQSFTRAYLEAALFTSTDESTPSGGYPLDQNYDVRDIAPETLARMERDAADFYSRNDGLLYESGLTPDQAGHDFWLSRNGHGSGFFDEGTPLDDRLQSAAERYGEYYLYVGDDGMIHGS